MHETPDFSRSLYDIIQMSEMAIAQATSDRFKRCFIIFFPLYNKNYRRCVIINVFAVFIEPPKSSMNTIGPAH